jgi:predicted N-acetyltransferase YhbS
MSAADATGIRTLRAEDTAAAHALGAGEGWNQTAADWSRLLQLDPDGCFGAWREGRLAGTVTCARHGDDLAWIGMMVVHPGFRRQGIGLALMRTALDHLRALGVRSIGLDATPAGEPLYQSLGFVAVAEVQRWQGIPRTQRAGDDPSVGQASLADLIALDRAAYAADRSGLLSALVAGAVVPPLLARSASGAPEGFVLARPGRIVTFVGPLVAATDGAAARLLDHVTRRLAGQEACIDHVQTGALETSTLAVLGLQCRRRLLRMCLGPAPAWTASPWICGSAGPELG